MKFPLLNTNHQALKYLNHKKNLSNMHMRWSNYVHKLPFVLNHKSGELNKVADSLSCRAQILIIMQQEVVGFEFLKDLYVDDDDLNDLWEQYVIKRTTGGYHVTNGFLLRLIIYVSLRVI